MGKFTVFGMGFAENMPKFSHTMNRSFIRVFSTSSFVILLAACGPKNETVKTDGAQEAARTDAGTKEYTLAENGTVLEWKATEKVGGGHNGQIKVTGGTLGVEAGALKTGKFEIDMNTIRVDDITDPKKNAKLVGHLKNEDFFAVDKFPTATFEITAVEKGRVPDSAQVKGNLTIKGITKNIAIPARIVTDSTRVDVAAAFSIDRTEWDIKYKSGKFFEDLGDNVINDAIQFKLALKADR